MKGPLRLPKEEQPKHADKDVKLVAGEEKQQDKKKAEAKGKRLPGSKIAAIVALVVLLAAGTAAGITYQMELWGGKVVPDVTGMTQADAAYMLQNKGFTVRSTTVPSDSTEGLVLLMDSGRRCATGGRRRGRHPCVNLANRSQGGRHRSG